MAETEFHEAFWLTVGAASPVLMLALVVTVTANLRLAVRDTRASAAFFRACVALIGTATSAIAFGMALNATMFNEEGEWYISPGVAFLFLVTAVICVFLDVLVLVTALYFVEARKLKGEVEPVGSPDLHDDPETDEPETDEPETDGTTVMTSVDP